MAVQYRYNTVRKGTVPYGTYSIERPQSYGDATEDRTMYFSYPKINTCFFQGLRLFLAFILQSTVRPNFI